MISQLLIPFLLAASAASSLAVDDPNCLTQPDSNGVVTVPAGTTNIPANAYQSCLGMTKLVLPDSLTSIGRESFVYCLNLTTVEWPADGALKSIGNWSFAHNTLRSIALPDGLESVGFAAFYGNTFLTSVTVPSSVTTVGGSAFPMCYGFGLEGDNSTFPRNPRGVVQCLPCANRRVLDIPGNVTKVGDGAFYKCVAVETINFPPSVTAVGYQSFYGLISVDTLDVPATIKTVDSCAFMNMNALVSVNIRNSTVLQGAVFFLDGCYENDYLLAPLCDCKPSSVWPCPEAPPPHPCSGVYGQECTADVSSWCCNLQTHNCACEQYGTADEIAKICAASKNGGIDCGTCPESSNCSAVIF